MSKDQRNNNNNTESKPKGGSRGRSGNNRARNKSEKFTRNQDKDTTTQSAKSCKTNDVAWYANNPELLKAAASFPMSTSTGERIPAKQLNSVPGILTLYWDPIVGNGEALNEAAAQTYSFVVHANSRGKSYNQADLMLMILAGANVFSAIASGVRAYGIMHRYLQQNLYTPKALINAMGFDYEDFKDNLSAMWFDLNDMISRVSSIWVPNTFSLIQRWFWMNSNIYMDDSLTKSQYYMYVQDHMYIYDETGSDQGGRLIINSDWGSTAQNVAAGTFKTWKQYTTAVNSMITALLNSEDRGIMYGDILAAYGENNLYSLSSITLDYFVEPQFDKEVLTQIENSVATSAVFEGLQSYPSGQIGKLWGTIPSDNMYVPANRKILNFHDLAEPNPADIMVATRLTFGKTRVMEYNASKKEAKLELFDCGSEIVTSYGISYYLWEETGPKLMTQFFRNGIPDSVQAYGFQLLALFAAFDWAPWLYKYTPAPALTVGMTLEVEPDFWIGDFGNYTFMDNEQIHKLNVTAVKSELGIASKA